MKASSTSAIFVASLLLLSGCGGKKISEGASEEKADSLYSEVPEIPSMLPDTLFPSARNIRYVIDCREDSSSGIINYTGDMYCNAPGAFTFRNRPLRQADFGGKVAGTPDTIIIDWKFETGYDTTRTAFGIWGGGTGWTGQPLYVEWPDSCVKIFKQTNSLTPNFNKRELIVGSLAGKVYFINPDNGEESRLPIDAGNPIKGTPSLDPTMNGNLYVGHGIPARKPFGTVTINLYKHEVTDSFDRDPKAWRGWGAYDSSPLRAGQFLFRPGENNTLYKYSVSGANLTLHSELRYTVNGSAPGIESSMCIYRNYGYICDNHGNIICINLNTLKPIWLYRLEDDIDATPVLEIEDGNPYLYVGCEVDRQGTGEASFVKLDAMSGSEIWKTELECERVEVKEKHFDGGYYASALPGRGNCNNLIFSNCVRNNRGQNGEFIAFNRNTGEIEYSIPLKYYAWSSPVGFMNEKNEMFILTGDTAGNLYIINGAEGKIVTSRRVGGNFESSPVVFGNSAVVGSRGRYIYKVSIQQIKQGQSC
ncbi:MAG: dehydrogenase [Paramuribaculum sp.]|nr:dehydrogenase [Paramuribaculum sp.]